MDDANLRVNNLLLKLMMADENLINLMTSLLILDLTCRKHKQIGKDLFDNLWNPM